MHVDGMIASRVNASVAPSPQGSRMIGDLLSRTHDKGDQPVSPEVHRLFLIRFVFRKPIGQRACPAGAVPAGDHHHAMAHLRGHPVGGPQRRLQRGPQLPRLPLLHRSRRGGPGHRVPLCAGRHGSPGGRPRGRALVCPEVLSVGGVWPASCCLGSQTAIQTVAPKCRPCFGIPAQGAKPEGPHSHSPASSSFQSQTPACPGLGLIPVQPPKVTGQQETFFFSEV